VHWKKLSGITTHTLGEIDTEFIELGPNPSICQFDQRYSYSTKNKIYKTIYQIVIKATIKYTSQFLKVFNLSLYTYLSILAKQFVVCTKIL